MTALHPLGWDERVQALLGDDPATVPGRVVRVDLDSCQVATADGDVRHGRARRWRSATGYGCASTTSARSSTSPPRWSQVTRRDPTGLTQVLAANVDLVLVAVPADRMSFARVEREVAIGWDSGAQPVVLLTKSDLDTGEAAQQLRDRLVGVDVIGVSSVTGDGADDVARLLQPARTGVLLGPSGAGKSTLTNLLAGREVAATGAVREGDRRGRHVTSARELQVLPSGGVLIDTPGLRSLSLAEDHGGVAAAFPDIEELGDAVPLPRLRARPRARLRSRGGAGGRDPRCRPARQLPQAPSGAGLPAQAGRSGGGQGGTGGLEAAGQGLAAAVQGARALTRPRSAGRAGLPAHRLQECDRRNDGPDAAVTVGRPHP